MSCIYILLAISYIYLTLRPMRKPQLRYLLTMLATSFFYLLTPFSVTLNIHNSVFFYIGMIGIGLFQAAAWPIVFKIVHHYYRP